MRGGAATIALAALFLAAPLRAEPEAPAPNRWEPGLLPVINYDSNLGFGFGAIGVLARFEEGYDPYRFRIQGLFQMNVAVDEAGDASLPMHDDYVRIDAPGIFGDKLRIQAELFFNKLATMPYYGVGPRTAEAEFSDTELERSLRARRYHHYDRAIVGGRAFLRFTVLKLAAEGEDPRLEVYDGTQVSYVWREVYPGSKLVRDIAARREAGPKGDALRALLHTPETYPLIAKSFGLLWDDRDHEFAPSRGSFTEIGVRLSPGAIDRLSHARLHVATRWFAPLFRDYLVFAHRAAIDVLGGDAPVDELTQIGVLQSEDFGGSVTIRGVPLRRFGGRLKLLGQAELRGSFPWFELLEQRLQIGVVAFVDAARVWADFESTPALDEDFERSPFTLGTGGGLRIRWADTFIMRADGAYSPTEDSTGIYVDVGHAF